MYVVINWATLLFLFDHIEQAYAKLVFHFLFHFTIYKATQRYEHDCAETLLLFTTQKTNTKQLIMTQVNTVYIDGINVLNKEDFAFFNKTFFSICVFQCLCGWYRWVQYISSMTQITYMWAASGVCIIIRNENN